MNRDVRLGLQFVNSREHLLCDRCGVFDEKFWENKIYNGGKATIPADCTYCKKIRWRDGVRLYSGLCTRPKMQDAQQDEAISPQPHWITSVVL